MKNYYKTLNLPNDASTEDIELAYQLYVAKFHPDKYNGDEYFVKRFKEIYEAYKILSDEINRAAYDRQLSNSLQKSVSDTKLEHQEKTHAPGTESKPNPLEIIYKGVYFTLANSYIGKKHYVTHVYKIYDESVLESVCLTKKNHPYFKIAAFIFLISSGLGVLLSCFLESGLSWLLFTFICLFAAYKLYYMKVDMLVVKLLSGKVIDITVNIKESDLIKRTKWKEWKNSSVSAVRTKNGTTSEYSSDRKGIFVDSRQKDFRFSAQMHNRPVIKYPKGWTTQKVMPVILMSLFCVSPHFALLYMALKVKNHRWLNVSIVCIAVWIIGLLFINVPNSLELGALFVSLTYLFSVVYICVNIHKFLYLMAIKEGICEPPPITHAPGRTPSGKEENRGRKMIADLHHWHNEVEPEGLRKDIKELIKLSEIALTKNNVDHDSFFARYDEVLNKILHKYDEIENTRLLTDEMRRTMLMIEENVSKIVVAFRKDVSNIYKEDLLDISAETSAFMRELQMKGLLED